MGLESHDSDYVKASIHQVAAREYIVAVKWLAKSKDEWERRKESERMIKVGQHFD